MSDVLRLGQDGHAMFWCPGCNSAHAVRVGGEKEPRWQWNGRVDRPTLSPSVLVTSGHFVSFHKPGDPCWCTYNAAHPERPAREACTRCHSFVVDGRIQFLADSTHALAGQTVDLPPWGDR